MTALLLAALIEISQYEPAFRHATPIRDAVSLSLTTNRHSYYPGEPFLLSIRATNVSGRPVRACLSFSTADRNLTLLHASPTSPLQPLPGLVDRTAHWGGGPRVFQPDESSTAAMLVSVTDPWRRPNVGEAVLAAIGTHVFKVSYLDTPSAMPGDLNGLLESDTITIEVVEPPPDEAPAAAAFTPSFGYIAQLDWGEGFISVELQAAAEDFIRNFPNSRYTPPLKSGLKNWLDYRTRMKWTNEEEKARLARLKTADVIAPSLSLSPAPAIIWPPNKAMVLVGVNLTTSDNSGGIPVVNLVSITCDESCDPSKDIAEADFGTDDRAFRLRADRKGGGNGRTYTITYEAADAAGNKATATTKVVVPHDKGKE